MSFCFVYGFLSLYKPNFGWGPNNGCCDQDTESVTTITRELSSSFLILASEYAYWFRERAMGEEKERVWERETLICCLSYAPHLGTELATQACTLIGNRTRDPLFYRKTLQPTEPCWPRWGVLLLGFLVQGLCCLRASMPSELLLTGKLWAILLSAALVSEFYRVWYGFTWPKLEVLIIN